MFWTCSKSTSLFIRSIFITWECWEIWSISRATVVYTIKWLKVTRRIISRKTRYPIHIRTPYSVHTCAVAAIFETCWRYTTAYKKQLQWHKIVKSSTQRIQCVSSSLQLMHPFDHIHLVHWLTASHAFDVAQTPVMKTTSAQLVW